MDTKDSSGVEWTGFSEHQGGGGGICGIVSRVSSLRGGLKGRAKLPSEKS